VSMTDEMRRSNIGVNTESSVSWCPCQRVEDLLPTPASAPAVEAVIDRREGSIHRRTVLPTETGAQDMNNPTDDPPVVMSAGAGVDTGKKRRNRAAQASSSSSSHPAHLFCPSGQPGRLESENPCHSQWLIGFGA
jgi:hypothetical protein